MNGIFFGSIAFALANGCGILPEEEGGCDRFEAGIPFFAIAAYAIGNAAGVYLTGESKGSKGDFGPTLLGSAIGVGLGVWAASAIPADYWPVGLLTFVAVSQPFPIFGYHLSEHLHAGASWQAPQGYDPEAPTAAALAQGLRPELKVDLMRF